MAEPHGLRHYLKAHFLDPTFKGLYQANAFDTALLIPYFIVLILLAAYGMHRYQLVYLYYKHRKNKVTDPESHFEELPQVTIQLPIFNEQYVIDRLVDCVCKMEYPREKLQIQVLDDSTDETVDVARGVVERYAALGHNIVYIHRTNREGYKAGALDNGLQTATGEFVAIFDADFTPQPDWLMKVIHHFANPRSAWCRRAGRTSTATTRSSPRSKRFCSTGTSYWSTAAARAPAFSSTSTARRACGGARPSTTPAAGSTTRSPRTPT